MYTNSQYLHISHSQARTSAVPPAQGDPPQDATGAKQRGTKFDWTRPPDQRLSARRGDSGRGGKSRWTVTRTQVATGSRPRTRCGVASWMDG